MRKITPYIPFFCFSGFTTTSGLPLLAGSCGSHINKKADIKCAADDNECQNEKAKKVWVKQNHKVIKIVST